MTFKGSAAACSPLLLWLGIVVACGGQQPGGAGGDATDPPAASATAPSTPERPCAAGTARDAAGMANLSLADPVCLHLSDAPASARVEAVTGKSGKSDPASYPLVGPDQQFVLPLALSPYGPTGCGANRAYSLVLTGVAGPDQAPGLSVELSCARAAEAAECGPEANRKGALGTTSGEPLCISWPDGFADERGFRVEITYFRGSEVFAYFLPPNATRLRVPPEAAPMLSESLERCLRRKDSELRVYALLADGSERLVGVESFIAECR